MSTVAERKAAQGYRTKPNSCSTCRNRVDVLAHWTGKWFTKAPGTDANGVSFVDSRRCGIGDFEVTKLATCDRWEAE